jgi:hypothetical protein
MSQGIQFTPEQIAALKALLAASIPASASAPAQPKPNPLAGILGASWKTALSGIVTVLAGFVQFAHQPPFSIAMPPLLLATAQFVMLGGVGAGFFFAKDAHVTGGSIVQPGIAVANPETVTRLAEHAGLPVAPSVDPGKVAA